MDGHLLHFQLPHLLQSAFSTRGLFHIDWPSASEHPLFYVGIYAAIGLLNALCTLLSVAAQYTGALRASRVLFKWVGYVWFGKLSLICILLGNFWSLLSELPSGSTIPPLKVSGGPSLSWSHLLILKLKGAWLIGLERFDLIFNLLMISDGLRFGKDMATIDSSLAGSLQSVNSSLASFFAAIITVASVWFYFQLLKSSNKCIYPTVLYFLTSWCPPSLLVLPIMSWRLDTWIQDAICEEWNPIQDHPFSQTLEKYWRE